MGCLILNILIFNGSPKGENSITYQTCLFLEKRFDSHTYDVVHVGKQIKSLEKDMSSVVEKVKNADLLVFAYPVYTFIAPYQVHRFIELLKQENIDFRGKFSTQITTSKHFYDVTAHKYVEENCLDMGLKVISGLSADMEDLLSKKGQKDAIDFFKQVFFDISNDIYKEIPMVNTCPLPNYLSKFTEKTVEKDMSKRVCIVTAIDEKTDESLIHMIDDFTALLPYSFDIVNLNDIGLKGGCISCFHCSVNGDCIYKDDFQNILRNRIQTSDAIVYAFSIKNHYADSIFKMYDDRQFCNGHRTVVKGTPIGYIISGHYSVESNLQMILEGRAEVGGTYLAGIVTNEKDVFTTSKLLQDMTKNLTFAIENKLERPANFYGIGGMKIFRDLIYEMQGLMKEDHRYYKKMGVYDFPQKKRVKIMTMSLVGTVMSLPSVKKKIGNNMTKYMLKPYKKVIEK